MSVSDDLSSISFGSNAGGDAAHRREKRALIPLESAGPPPASVASRLARAAEGLASFLSRRILAPSGRALSRAGAATIGAVGGAGRRCAHGLGAALRSIVGGLAIAVAALIPGATGRDPGPKPADDVASRWLVLIVAAAMGFLAGLALAASNIADAVAQSWTTELEASATITIDTPADAAAAAELRERALAAVRGAQGVAGASILSDEDVAALLAPWLGREEGLVSDLPLPLLIDVELRPAAVEPLQGIAARLIEAGVTAEIDAHGGWVDRLAPTADRIRALAALGLLIIAVAAGVMVALACVTAMASQRRMVSVLKLVGAQDGDIAAMFMRRFQGLAFLGSSVGVAAAGALAFTGGSETGAAGEIAPFAPVLEPDPWIWAQFIAAPLGFALIAAFASWIAVTFALQRAEL